MLLILAHTTLLKICSGEQKNSPISALVISSLSVMKPYAGSLNDTLPSTCCLGQLAGRRLNIKNVFPCMDFHYKDKTVVRPSYLYSGIPILLRRLLCCQSNPNSFVSIWYLYIETALVWHKSEIEFDTLRKLNELFVHNVKNFYSLKRPFLFYHSKPLNWTNINSIIFNALF